MRYKHLVAAVLAGAATAHTIPGLPQMLGGRKAQGTLKNLRDAVKGAPAPGAHEPSRRNLHPRQNPTTCGPDVGSCADTDCCSLAGYCGTGIPYCAAPGCQQDYGPACDANQKPSGVDTSDVDRTQFGSVSYNGAGIYDCIGTGDVAITFDDGPYSYTSTLLDLLDTYDAKATFFMTGNNLGKGMINDPSTVYPAMIQRMHDAGHQIASHTWSHQNSSQTSATQWTEQMVWLEIAINDILGFFPTYMRPPYSICEAQCQSILSDLGYHITYFDFDTQGYLHNTIDTIQGSKDIVDATLASSSPATDSWLHIEHDIHEVVVNDFMEYMLQQLVADGWNMVTAGECLGDPVENWYRTVGDSSGTSTTTTASSTATATGPVSTDATCGTDGITCLGSEFGDCCSQYGWCGTTDGHCGTGCQSDFGTCDNDNDDDNDDDDDDDDDNDDDDDDDDNDDDSSATGPVSTDATCGTDGITCLGSEFGDCCSQHGWCGTTNGHCGTGCQSDFGSCT